jgi:16S rRNA (uracil1498-N3)-methyltransferase
MPSYRFFVENILPSDKQVTLHGDEAHHLKNVMRVKEKEIVELIDGKGSLYTARVEFFSRHEVTLTILSSKKISEKPFALTLALALLRPNHFDYALEKATEVGIDSFVIFQADKSERKLSPNLEERTKALLLSACKQSGRLFVPKVKFVKSLQDALKNVEETILWADLCDEALPLYDRLQSLDNPKHLALLVGPEGGWSEKEKTLLQEFGKPVLLHPNTLRAETAALVFAYACFAHCSLRR